MHVFNTNVAVTVDFLHSITLFISITRFIIFAIQNILRNFMHASHSILCNISERKENEKKKQKLYEKNGNTKCRLKLHQDNTA